MSGFELRGIVEANEEVPLSSSRKGQRVISAQNETTKALQPRPMTIHDQQLKDCHAKQAACQEGHEIPGPPLDAHEHQGWTGDTQVGSPLAEGFSREAAPALAEVGVARCQHLHAA